MKLINDNNINTIGRLTGSPLYYAIECNRPKLVDWLIRRGADVNYHDAFTYSPLLKAIWFARVECVQLLSDACCELNTVYNNKYTPLGYTILFDHEVDFIHTLIDRGASTIFIDDTYALNTLKMTQKRDHIVNSIKQRNQTRYQAITILAIHKQKCGPSYFIKQDKYITRLISKHVWSMRFNETNRSPK
jgi:ankyrin repeat protein